MHANKVIERALGKYGGELPGIVEIWTKEAKLSGLRKQLQDIFGMKVDISIIKQGGSPDNPSFITFG